MPGPAQPGLKETSPETMAAVSHAAAGLQDVKGFGLGLLQNRWNRKYNERMYEKQRADALADWQRSADYNSPQAQMTRYKEAGLNPNLIYGSATNSPMAQMKNADLETSELPPYQINRNSVGDAIGTYQNLRTTNQQIDNLAAQNEFIKSQTNLNNLRALTEALRPGLIEEQTGNEYWKKRLNARLDSHQNIMNPHLQKLAEERITNIIANTGYTEARTSMIPGLVALNAQRILESKAKTAKTWNENNHVTQLISLTKSKTFQNDLENLMRMQGTSYKDGAITRGFFTGGTTNYQIPNSIEKVYKNIVPGWEKMSNTDKAYYLMHESLNK